MNSLLHVIGGKIVGTFTYLLGQVIDLEFNTHEEMIEAALQWQLEEYQLDSGSFSGYIKIVHTGHTQIANTFRSNGVFVKGKTPSNVYLFASGKSEGKMTHNGMNVLEDELVVLTDTDQLDFILSSSVDDTIVAVDKDFFDHSFEKHFNKPFKYNTQIKRIQLKDNTGKVFRTKLNDILSDLIEQQDKLRHDSGFHVKTEQAIMQIIFDNIDFSKSRKDALASEVNAEKIRKHIEKNFKNNISINELCTSEKLSERTLRSGFQNLFGLSPKQYHKSFRLGKIHHAFLKADPTIESVEKIAYEYGFTHMGRFSNHYKSMFGNTPSYTLKKFTT